MQNGPEDINCAPKCARNVGYDACGSRDCSCNAGVSPAVPESASPQGLLEEMPARGQRYGARGHWVLRRQAFRYVRILGATLVFKKGS